MKSLEERKIDQADWGENKFPSAERTVSYKATNNKISHLLRTQEFSRDGIREECWKLESVGNGTGMVDRVNS